MKIPSKHGRGASNDFRVDFNLENWIESMGADGNREETFPMIHYIANPRRDSNQGRTIFMTMYNDIVCGENGNDELCIVNSINVA